MNHSAPSRRLRTVIGLSAMALCGAKCSPAQTEFLVVQVCLADQTEIVELAEAMREVARAEGLRFTDGSAETANYLKSVRDKGLVQLDHIPTINMGIEGDYGLGVTAGNLGLPSNQVALGFTAGRNSAKAHKLANHLVRLLSKRWRVQRVPEGQGSLPITSCDKRRDGAFNP